MTFRWACWERSSCSLAGLVSIPGSTLAATDGILPVAAVNTMIAGAFGGFSSMLYMMFVHPAKETGSRNVVAMVLCRPGRDHVPLRIRFAYASVLLV